MTSPRLDNALTAFGIAQWARSAAPGQPVLVLSGDAPERLTLTRSTNSVDALIDGLAAYLRQWSINVSGREFRFIEVIAGTVPAEQRAQYPSAVVTSPQPVMYAEDDDTELGTGLETVWLDEERQVGYSILGMTRTTLSIDVWATSRPERTAAVALIEDALTPEEEITGARVRIPRYHNAVARYSLTSAVLLDSDADDAKRYVIAQMSVDAVIPTIRVRGVRAPQVLRADVTVTPGEDTDT